MSKLRDGIDRRRFSKDRKARAYQEENPVLKEATMNQHQMHLVKVQPRTLAEVWRCSKCERKIVVPRQGAVVVVNPGDSLVVHAGAKR